MEHLPIWLLKSSKSKNTLENQLIFGQWEFYCTQLLQEHFPLKVTSIELIYRIGRDDKELYSAIKSGKYR